MHMENSYIPLPDRRIVRITGPDAKNFLQGIITNDIHKVSPEHAIYALILTPQGKFLYDFFIAQRDDALLLDVHETYVDSLVKRLSMYKLRSDVSIEKADDYVAAAIHGYGIADEIEGPELGKAIKFCKGVAYIDPRNASLGARAIIERENNFQAFEAKGFSEAPEEHYHTHRINEAVPEGFYDLVSEDAFPLQYGLDDLGAIDFNKGCYVGQEVTARSKHRGSIRKGTFLLSSKSNQFPPALTPVRLGDKVIGNLLSNNGTVALALLEKKNLQTAENEQTILQADDISLRIS